MRIAMVADTYKPYVSGVTVFIDLCRREFQRRGHEVNVLAYGAGPPPEPGVIHSPSIPHVPTGYRLGYPLSSAARRAIAAADIVHVHHPFLSGRAALPIARRHAKPVVFTNHTRYDIYTDIYIPWALRPLARMRLAPYLREFCRRVDLAIAPSEGIRDTMLGLGIDAPIDVVSNPVDVTPFQHRVAPADRAAWGFAPETALFAYVGRLSPEKDLGTLLEAFARARARAGGGGGAGRGGEAEPLGLLLIGDGPSCRPLTAQAERLGLTPAVHFPGMVPHAELPRVLAACDAFVSPSTSEVHPLTFLEAMAAGLPTVGVRSPGVGDIIAQGRTGLLAEPGVAPLAQALSQLAADPSLRRRLGDEARRAASGYDISQTTRALLERYERLVGARTRGPEDGGSPTAQGVSEAGG